MKPVSTTPHAATSRRRTWAGFGFAPLLAASLAASVAALAPAVAHAADPPAAEVKRPGSTVNINTADDKELQSLPRIGPATAARILEYRKQIGSFKSVDELLNVKGIGEKTLEFLRPLVTVGVKPAGGGKP